MNLPRHDPNHLQLPIEAANIYLDLAFGIMKKNPGINEDDWAWFDGKLNSMKEELVTAYGEWKKTRSQK